MSPADRAALARLNRAMDERVGSAGPLRKTLRYVFPDHWSFLLGEINVFSFVVLVGTGVFLTLFYEPSLAETVYDGPYEPLEGARMSEAYASVLRLSFDVPAGLLIRQTHHWAALVFVLSIVLHLMRVFFTGAFRKPRELNWIVGLLLLGLALLLGFTGYSLVDDLLSGMGLVIAYAVAIGAPVIGDDLVMLIWGGPYPGDEVFLSRLFVGHVLILPAITATLIAVHLGLIAVQKHTQFPGRGRAQRNVIGTPLWAGQALRSGGLLVAVAAVLFLMGGLIQINPVWDWGPYEPYLSTNAAQPDIYLGWLIGALRIFPHWEPVLFDYTLASNPFIPGALYPLALFALMFAWPFLERVISRDRASHHLLDHPRDKPWRTAFGVALLTNVAMALLPGASDRVLVQLGIPYVGQIWFFRVAFFLAPVVAFAITLAATRRMRARSPEEVAAPPAQVVRRLEDGSFAADGRGDGQVRAPRARR